MTKEEAFQQMKEKTAAWLLMMEVAQWINENCPEMLPKFRQEIARRVHEESTEADHQYRLISRHDKP